MHYERMANSDHALPVGRVMPKLGRRRATDD